MLPRTCGDSYGAVSVAATRRLEMDVVDPMAVLFSQNCADDPLPTYRQVRESCPVSRGGGMFEGTAAVYLTRYEDVVWALRHPETFSSAWAVSIGQEQPLIPLQIDPPEHAQ